MVHVISREQALHCSCWFCEHDRPHKHTITSRFIDIGCRTLVAESTKPEHQVWVEGCELCGHIREREPSGFQHQLDDLQ